MKRRTILGWLCLIFPGPLVAQPGIITTIAGTGGFSGDGGLATQACLFIPKDVAVDANGNVYIADQGNDRIRRVDRNGVITTIAGGGNSLGDGGPATQANLDRPSGVAVDTQGVIYIADTGHHRVRRVSPSGIITTIAGTGNPGFSGDGGPATQASLGEPVKVAVDGQGVIYITQPASHRVRRVDASGIITTLAGTGLAGFSGDDGPARFARLNMPSDVAVDAQGVVYIADTENHRVRRVDSNGTITAFAGGGNQSRNSGDGGMAVQAWMLQPKGVAADAQGVVYIADTWNSQIRRVDRNGIITTIAGLVGTGGPDALFYPNGLAVDAQGVVYIADTYNHLVRRMGPDHSVRIFAGIWRFAEEGSGATQVPLSVVGVAVDPHGAVYIADWRHHSISRVSLDGAITTIAGTGSPGHSGDGGPAHQASLSWPRSVAVDAQGIVYIAVDNHIRRIGLDGVITTFAGSGNYGYSGDGGPALLADLVPHGVTVDDQGVVYFADAGNQRIRRIDSDGTITTIAGTGSIGYSGDGGPATQAQLCWPEDIAVDAQGVVYIADDLNHRIRRVGLDGIITTIAGTGEPGFSGDGGPAAQAQLNLSQPSTVAVDRQGVVYIVDRLNHRIRRVGLDGIITTFAGTGDWGFSGDGGPAIQARLNLPADVAVDAQGNVYIADEGNFRVRKVNARGEETSGGLQVDSPWPMLGYDVRHTGRSPYVGPQTGSLKWRFPIGGELRSAQAVQADGTVVSVGREGRPASSPAIGADGTVYIGSADGHLYAINADGSEHWRFPTGGGIQSSPAIGADGTVYVGSWDGYVYAIDANGRERWRFKTGWIVSSSPAIGTDGSIYITSEDGFLYAIDASGRKRWQFNTNRPDQLSPAIGVDGTIYVGSLDGQLHALQSTGVKKWSFRASAGTLSSPVIGDDGAIYVSSWDRHVDAIDVNGRERWQFPTINELGLSPAIGVDGTIYVGSTIKGSYIYAIDVNGRERWRFPTDEGIWSSPVLGADGTIYSGSLKGYVYAIDANGRERWRFDAGAEIRSSPAISSDGTIYVEAEDGYLYAIGNAGREGVVDQQVPSLALSATSLSFGSTYVGATSQKSFRITNTGSASLSVTGIALSGTASAQFRITPTTAAIAPDTYQTFTVSFAPTSAGTKSASLSISHNAAGSLSTVSLSGTAVAAPAPDITVSPATLDFGTVRVVRTSTLTLAIQNTGSLPLVVDSIQVAGPAYSVSSSSATVAAGGRTEVMVTFTPSSVGPAIGELVLVSNDPDIRHMVVPLAGMGRSPHVTASVDTLSFGHVLAGSSATAVLTITNNSVGAINVTNVVPGDPQYRVSSRSFTLAAGGSRDVTVTFAPIAGQPSESILTILTGDAEVPALTVGLSATSAVAGGPAAIAVLPTSLTFGSVVLGQSKSVNLLVTNEGGSSLRVLNVVASSNDVTVSKSSFTLAAGAEEQLTVTLQPTVAGSLNETLELQSNDPVHPTVQVPLRATVTSGTGRPTLALDSPSLSLGQVAVGETSEFLLPVRNAGTATLTLSNVISDNVQVVASPTSLSIPPQETRSLTVRYRPLPGMPLSGRLTLYSNDTAQPQVGVSWSAVEVRTPYLQLARMTPADGAFGVATTTELQLVFSEPLYYRRGFTALDLTVTPEPLSGPVDEDVQVRGDGRTVVIPVTLARNTVYRLVVYGATGRSGLELFDMVEASFSTGAAPPVLAKVSGRVTETSGLAVSGSVYLMDASHRLSAQASIALDGSFELTGVAEGSYGLYLDGTVADGRTATGSYDSNGDGTADALVVRAGVDQTGLVLTTTVRSGTAPAVSNSPVVVDLDSSVGNQGLATLSGTGGGKSVVLEVYATAADGWTGAAVTVLFDSTQVSFAGAEAGTGNLLQQSGGTALFLSHVDPAASTVEFGGAILGPTSATAVSGAGLLGRFRFTTVDGFSGETALHVTLVKVHTLTGRTEVQPNLSAILRSSGGGTPTASTGPLTLDFNPAEGDQGQTTGSGATIGKTYQVQVYGIGAPTINGWSAKLEYDPVQVRYVPGSFQPSSLVPGLVSLVEEKSSYVSIGGAVLGGSGTGSGSGLLGTATFEVLSGFTGSTELVIRQMSWKVVGSGEQMLTVDVRGTITAAAAGLAGDFNGDGAVNFSDFFLFADAFGGSDPAYDLNDDGAVNFSDFFVFADAFGSEARAKLIELAQQYLGLPAQAGIESAYPNPFNASTTVRYRLAEAGSVQLAVYSLTGQRVAVLVDERQEAGSYQVTWDGRAEDGTAVATGIYLLRLAGLDGVQVRKVTLLR